MNVVFSKKVGWAILAALLFIDAFLTVIRDVEGNPLWQPAVEIIGINAVPLLVPPVLVLFYFVIKGAGWLVKKVDKTPQAEDLLLTSLVLVFFVYDLWVISVDFLGFRLIKSHIHLIPILVAVILAYSLWAERKLKKK